MDNNGVLRSLRYAFDYTDADLVRILALSGRELSVEVIGPRTRREGEDGAVECEDRILSGFLDGLIIEKRGPPDPSRPPPKRVPFTNNEILKKLRIALNLRDTDMLELLELGGQPLSKAELSAFFRKPHNRQYRECGNQVLRAFLRGLKRKSRPKSAG